MNRKNQFYIVNWKDNKHSIMVFELGYKEFEEAVQAVKEDITESMRCQSIPKNLINEVLTECEDSLNENYCYDMHDSKDTSYSINQIEVEL